MKLDSKFCNFTEKKDELNIHLVVYKFTTFNAYNPWWYTHLQI